MRSNEDSDGALEQTAKVQKGEHKNKDTNAESKKGMNGYFHKCVKGEYQTVNIRAKSDCSKE